MICNDTKKKIFKLRLHTDRGRTGTITREKKREKDRKREGERDNYKIFYFSLHNHHCAVYKSNRTDGKLQARGKCDSNTYSLFPLLVDWQLGYYTHFFCLSEKKIVEFLLCCRPFIPIIIFLFFDVLNNSIYIPVLWTYILLLNTILIGSYQLNSHLELYFFFSLNDLNECKLCTVLFCFQRKDRTKFVLFIKRIITPFTAFFHSYTWHENTFIYDCKLIHSYSHKRTHTQHREIIELNIKDKLRKKNY